MEGAGRYSRAGLRAVHPQLADLAPLPMTPAEQLREARLRADKMSVQGVQPKLSAVLKRKDGVVRLAPAYDLPNTMLVLGNAPDESALPLRGKKRKLTRRDWVA